jgi:hypothetical protein
VLLPNCRAQDVRIAATGGDGTVRTDSAGFALNLQGVPDAEPEAGADTRHGRVVSPPVLQRNDRDPPTYRESDAYVAHQRSPVMELIRGGSQASPHEASPTPGPSWIPAPGRPGRTLWISALGQMARHGPVEVLVAGKEVGSSPDQGMGGGEPDQLCRRRPRVGPVLRRWTRRESDTGGETSVFRHFLSTAPRSRFSAVQRRGIPPRYW